MWGQNVDGWASNFCGFGSSFGHGPWMFGGFFSLLFWGIIIYTVIAIIRAIVDRKRDGQNDGAMAILRNRFASGEINEKEFNAQKAILSRK